MSDATNDPTDLPAAVARLAEVTEQLARAAAAAREPLAVGRIEAARLLSMSEDKFDRSWPVMAKLGFPQPFDFNGVSRWSVAELRAWVAAASKRRRGVRAGIERKGA